MSHVRIFFESQENLKRGRGKRGEGGDKGSRGEGRDNMWGGESEGREVIREGEKRFKVKRRKSEWERYLQLIRNLEFGNSQQKSGECIPELA